MPLRPCLASSMRYLGGNCVVTVWYNALEKSLDFDLALDDFPCWLLCVLLEDSIWALGSGVHVCLLKILRRSPILKDKILFTCGDVMVRCSVL